jgi:hypothetical protein
MVKLLPALLLASLATFALPHTVAACDCVTRPFARRAQFGPRDVVFLGRVTAAQSLEYVEFEVVEAFTGRLDRRVRIPTGRSDCDYFNPPLAAAAGDEFLVYATRLDEKTLVVNQCSGSGPLPRKNRELARLRQIARQRSE